MQEALRLDLLLKCMVNSDVEKHSCATPFVFCVRYTYVVYFPLKQVAIG